MSAHRDWAESTYSRIYHSVLTDSKFESVYDDDTAFAWWVRLLIQADATFPAPASLPRSLPKKVLDVLTAVGLIDVMRGDLYRISGHDKEREARDSRYVAGGRARASTARRAGNGQFKPATLVDAGPATSSEYEKEKEKEVTKPSTFSKATHSSKEPRLTKAQLEAWRSFGPEWDDLKDAWLAHGFLWPPSGSPDEDGSQRALLYQILDFQPHNLPRWVREAKGRTTSEVIGYVLTQWHAIRDEAGVEDDPPEVVPPTKAEAIESLKAVLTRIAP